MTFRQATKMSDMEVEAARRPDYFVACRYLGRCTYDKQQAPSLEQACEYAAAMYDPVDRRPVMIYAVTAGYQAMIGTWAP